MLKVIIAIFLFSLSLSSPAEEFLYRANAFSKKGDLLEIIAANYNQTKAVCSYRYRIHSGPLSENANIVTNGENYQVVSRTANFEIVDPGARTLASESNVISYILKDQKGMYYCYFKTLVPKGI
jgi:hypothetical protein